MSLVPVAPEGRSAADFELRIPLAADAEAWFELFDDAEVMRYIGGGDIQPLEWYREFVVRQQKLAEETGLCLFSVVRTAAVPTGSPGGWPDAASAARGSLVVASPGTVAGFAGIQPWRHPWGPTGRLEIGWRLGTAHQGLGLATAAARVCLARAAAAGIPDPIAMIDVRNAASIGVASKLGMVKLNEVDSPSGVRVAVYGRFV